MTESATAATLFGPEDLRIVEHPLGPLAPGMVRVRFGAGAFAAPTCTISAMPAPAISSSPRR